MIVVNDEERPLREGMTIQDLLEELDPRLPMAVVRIGNVHVPRREWTTRVLKDGEEIRVVHMIAGG